MKKEKTKIKAVFIDPTNKTITDIEIVPDFAHYYEIMDTTIIEAAHPIKGHTLWLDEEGQLKNNSYFRFNNFPLQVFAGKAVFVKGTVGSNTAYSADQLRKHIHFM